MAKIIEDALAKQKENFKFKLKMAMMRMKEEHDQQIRAMSNQLGESNRHNIANQAGSDSDVDEHLDEDNPPADQNARGGPTEDNNARGGPCRRLKLSTRARTKLEAMKGRVKKIRQTNSCAPVNECTSNHLVRASQRAHVNQPARIDQHAVYRFQGFLTDLRPSPNVVRLLLTEDRAKSLDEVLLDWRVKEHEISAKDSEIPANFSTKEKPFEGSEARTSIP
uniref:Uncharacterized protein n=1 Tax=Asparagus officinalis TaxID=4686 RepID=Q2XNV9_ASPOF|nr:hypothetical protein 12.t00024 [Asparagus officinalis]